MSGGVRAALIGAIVVLIILSGFFSAADMVYGAVNQLRLKKRAEKGKKTAKWAYKLARDYSGTIATVLFCNNLVNIGAASLATIVGVDLLGKAVGAPVATVVLLLLVLTFGEIVPKAVGRIYSYRLSLIFVYPVWVFRVIFFPVVWLTSSFAKLCAKPFIKIKKEAFESGVSGEELEEMVDTIEAEGVIDEGEGELLRSAIGFRETRAYEIMTPRVDVYAIELNSDVHKLIAREESELFRHSRVPVYRKSIDRIVGFVSTKIILKKLLKGEMIDLPALLVKPFFVPRSMLIKDVLSVLKAHKAHVAIVKDEYGGTEGLLTIEDIVEELVGDIWDENDVVSEPYEKLGANKYVVDGAMGLGDFFKLLDVREDEEARSASVGGWCVDRLGRFAKEGDRFSYENIDVSIVEVKDFTVEKLIVTLRKKPEEEA